MFNNTTALLGTMEKETERNGSMPELNDPKRQNWSNPDQSHISGLEGGLKISRNASELQHA